MVYFLSKVCLFDYAMLPRHFKDAFYKFSQTWLKIQYFLIIVDIFEMFFKDHEKVLQHCVEINLVLNWKKMSFYYKGG